MPRRLAAEFVGTAFLLLAVVGSGIATSDAGAASTQLFQHAAIVGLALCALILTFGPISGAHLNPAVTIADATLEGMSWRDAAGYVVAQTLGGCAGVLATNLLFDLPAITIATTDRAGAPLAASEAVATFGLVVVIFGVANRRAVPAAVGAYIAAAIFFTPSTALANPAVTLARILTNTWTGVAPGSAPAYIVAQILGGLGAVLFVRWLFRPQPADAARVVVPHEPEELT